LALEGGEALESIQLIKNRIKSIEGTRQITRSMRLVSTAKVQKARSRMLANRPFMEEVQRLADIAGQCMDGLPHPFLEGREVRCSAVVVIGGDRGLCGGYNINVARHALSLIESLGKVQLIAVGAKSREFFRRRLKAEATLLTSFTAMSEIPSFADVVELADLLLGLYKNGEVDEIHICYTQFETMLLQTPKTIRLLPLDLHKGEKANEITRFEPAGEEFLTQAVSFYVTSALYGALLESAACEQSARITSMDGAAKAADEMIAHLTLRYNQARQGAITQELTEIVSGANAVAQKREG